MGRTGLFQSRLDQIPVFGMEIKFVSQLSGVPASCNFDRGGFDGVVADLEKSQAFDVFFQKLIEYCQGGRPLHRIHDGCLGDFPELNFFTGLVCLEPGSQFPDVKGGNPIGVLFYAKYNHIIDDLAVSV